MTSADPLRWRPSVAATIGADVKCGGCRYCSQLFRCAVALRSGGRADVLLLSHPMPLPPSPVPRKRLHERRILYEGYLRADGLFDIDTHLVDAKDHDYELLTGVRPAREAVHDMWARVTIDRAFCIHAIDVHADAMPYPGACDRIEPAYSKLVGAILVQGFRKRLHDDLGGVRGCTHVTELLGALPTAAVQMFAGLQREDAGEGKPFQLDHCHALATKSDTVRQYYPKWYRGDGIRDDCPDGPDSPAVADAGALSSPTPTQEPA